MSVLVYPDLYYQLQHVVWLWLDLPHANVFSYLIAVGSQFVGIILSLPQGFSDPWSRRVVSFLMINLHLVFFFDGSVADFS